MQDAGYGLFENSVMANFAEFTFRNCLENSWTDRMERFLVAQSVEKEAFHPIPLARGITKWSLLRSFQTVSLGTWVNIPDFCDDVQRMLTVS